MNIPRPGGHACPEHSFTIAPNTLNEKHLLTLLSGLEATGVKDSHQLLQPQYPVPSGSSVNIISFIHLVNLYWVPTLLGVLLRTREASVRETDWQPCSGGAFVDLSYVARDCPLAASGFSALPGPASLWSLPWPPVPPVNSTAVNAHMIYLTLCLCSMNCFLHFYGSSPSRLDRGHLDGRGHHENGGHGFCICGFMAPNTALPRAASQGGALPTQPIPSRPSQAPCFTAAGYPSSPLGSPALTLELHFPPLNLQGQLSQRWLGKARFSQWNGKRIKLIRSKRVKSEFWTTTRDA